MITNDSTAQRPERVRFGGIPPYVREVPLGRRSLAVERAVDAILADSFPASDPPSWTPGMAETRPRHQPHVVSQRSATAAPSWWRPIASFIALMLVVLASPLFVLGLPLALAWRAVLAATKWRAA